MGAAGRRSLRLEVATTVPAVLTGAIRVRPVNADLARATIEALGG